MKIVSFYYILVSSFILIAHCLPNQQVFMAPNDRGDIWSLCGNPSSHQLIGYRDGVYISPEQPKTGQDIHVQVRGNLLKDVTGGSVDIDLSIMGMIKIKKQLDLCSVLNSDIMGYQACPLSSGDLVLDAKAWIPKELPKLPLEGNIHISDQDGQTVTCIRLNIKLQ